MSRILAYTSPARGHLYPLTPILTELRSRGHEVSLRTLSSQVELMRGLGLDAAPIDPAIEAIEHDDWRARGQQAALRRSVGVFCSRAAHDAPDLQRAIDEERLDACLVDIQSWGALAAAEAWGGPWASFCPYPLPLPSDWPDSVRLVGPCAWDPPAEPPEWLAEVRRPLVLVTTSSEFQDDGRLVRAALEALADEDVEVVATLPAADVTGFEVPANARVLP